MKPLKIHILKSGLYTSIQDQGRKKFSYFGIPVSGYLDEQAANRALAIVGNPKGSAVLEINQLGPTLYFEEEAYISLTGGTIDTELQMNKGIHIPAKSILKLGSVTNGMRTYLAIRGEWQVKQVFNSCSAFSYPSFGIQALTKEDYIQINPFDKNIKKSKEKFTSIDYNAINRISILAGPETDLLQDTTVLETETFRISPHSNRMAALLESKTIVCKVKEIQSSAIIPGTIQLLPNGKLFVILNDGQTTGGYPRIGLIPNEELWKFNQIKPMKEFHFSR